MIHFSFIPPAPVIPIFVNINSIISEISFLTTAKLRQKKLSRNLIADFKDSLFKKEY